MEEVARLDDAPLIPTIVPEIDASLRHRIRSLIVTHNQHNPPTIPYLSPNHHYDSFHSDKNCSGEAVISIETDPGATRATAKPTKVDSTDARMGAVKSRGPAGQIPSRHSSSYPRRPSQPVAQLDRGSTYDGNTSPHSGLDRRAHGDMLGRDISPPINPGRMKSSASATSRIPRFHLRTVPPATDVNKIIRPSQQHVPGSYISEIVNSREHKSDQLRIPVVQNTAIHSLHDVLDHDQSSKLLPTSDLNGTTSDTFVSKSKPVQQPQIPALGPVDIPVSASESQPMVEESGTPKHPPQSIPGTPLFVIGDKNDRDDSMISPITRSQSIKAPLLDGPQLSSLLAELPSVNQSSLDQFSRQHLTVKSSTSLGEEILSPYSNFLPAEPSMSVGTGDNVDNQASPLLSDHVSTVVESTAAEKRVSSSRRSSKLSAVSKALSIFSELSSRSGIPSPSRNAGTVKKGSAVIDSNLTARPSHRPIRTVRGTPGQGPKKASVKQHHKHTSANRYQRLDDTESTNGALALQKHDESFTKVISNLEHLLKEALVIAGTAASHDESGHGRPKRSSSTSSETVSSLMGNADEEANFTTLPPHRGASDDHVIINEPEEDVLYRGNFHKVRDATPYPAQTRHTSAVSDPDDNQPELKHRGTNREFLELPRISSKTGTVLYKPLQHQPFSATDWAPLNIPSKSSESRLERRPLAYPPKIPPPIRAAAKEQRAYHVREHGASEEWSVTRETIRDHVHNNTRPPIEPRISSIRRVRSEMDRTMNDASPGMRGSDESDCDCVPYVADFNTAGLRYHPVFQEAMASNSPQIPRHGPFGIPPRKDTLTSLRGPQGENPEKSRHASKSGNRDYNLEGRHHFSISEPHGFSLSRSHRRSPIARDWSTARKRYVATVTCITTAFMGLLIGIYAGEVPAIQYAIADEHHYVILGNVFFFLGLAITTALFYPLPLLHGRKPYTLAALAILLPLQFPQALAINSNRSPHTATYRIGLLVPRMFAGIVMGFVNINFITTLLDLFGSSLQSGNPHQETVNVNDVRRHGGGMGVWLSIWVWSAIGSLGIGFLIGAGIISKLDVSWGYWITIILNAAVLVLNVLTPEVRRSAYRRSMAEVRDGSDVSRRVARGEIKMHLRSTGPVWWWEEVFEGHVLAVRMLKQPGFFVLSLYLGWIYGQIVLVIVVSDSQIT